MRFKMTTKTSSPIIKIKKELPSDEIKVSNGFHLTKHPQGLPTIFAFLQNVDFAETAMNELLGWYGYDNVERVDMPKIASKINNNNNLNCNRNNTTNNSKSNSDNGNSDNNNKNMNNCNSNNSLDDNSNNANNNNQSDEMLSQQRINCNTRYTTRNSTVEFSTSRHRSLSPDKNSSRESSNSPHLKVAEPNDFDCAWCRRPIISSVEQFSSQQDGGASYCSESCFAQSRRASFKRAKTCDWCRHVRHAVSYVDFQDGASQLQFCSDKCLNQYKMQIFCKETQAHLDMNPHLKEKGKGSSANLITPELWLKNCRSRSNSPKSDNSHTDSNITNPMSSSSPPSATIVQMPTSNLSSVSPTVSGISMGIQKPLISVAPPSKLMSIPPSLNQSMAKVGSMSTRSAVSTSRRRRSGRIMTSQKTSGALNNNSNTNSGNNNVNPKPCTVINPQDLRVNFAQSSEKLMSPQGQQSKPPDDYQSFMAQPPPHNMFSIRPPHMMQPPHQVPMSHFQQHPSTINGSPFSPPPTAIPQLFPHLQNMDSFKLPPFGPPPPPVTILVPYPIIIPLPIPIPIPLPMSHFLPRPPKEVTKVEQPEQDDETIVDDEMDNDQPLDCTKSKETDTSSTYTIKASEPYCDTNISNNIERNSSPIQQQQQQQQQKIPKFKIKRFNSKRIITNSEIDLECVDIVDSGSSKNISEALNPEPPYTNDIKNHNEHNSDSNVNNSNSNNNSSNRPKSSDVVIQQISKESESSRPLRKRKRIIDIGNNLKAT